MRRRGASVTPKVGAVVLALVCDAATAGSPQAEGPQDSPLVPLIGVESVSLSCWPDVQTTEGALSSCDLREMARDLPRSELAILDSESAPQSVPLLGFQVAAASSSQGCVAFTVRLVLQDQLVKGVGGRRTAFRVTSWERGAIGVSTKERLHRDMATEGRRLWMVFQESLEVARHRPGGSHNKGSEGGV